MKASIFSLVAALGLLASSASFAASAAASDPYKGRKEALRYERKAELERARREAAYRKAELERQRRLAAERQRLEQQRAQERARWESQHRHDDHSHGRDYGYRH